MEHLRYTGLSLINGELNQFALISYLLSSKVRLEYFNW